MNSGGYIAWQIWEGPKWILMMGWTFQRALFRLFSVEFMVRTLIAHWHKDAVAYTGSLSSRIMAFTWNGISRAIGFCIRSIVLAMWILSACILGVVHAGAFIGFLVWPLVSLGLIATGIGLLLYV